MATSGRDALRLRLSSEFPKLDPVSHPGSIPGLLTHLTFALSLGPTEIPCHNLAQCAKNGRLFKMKARNPKRCRR